MNIGSQQLCPHRPYTECWVPPSGCSGSCSPCKSPAEVTKHLRELDAAFTNPAAEDEISEKCVDVHRLQAELAKARELLSQWSETYHDGFHPSGDLIDETAAFEDAARAKGE